MPATTLEPVPSAASSPRDPDEMLTALYADHGSALRRFAARLSGDHSRADDIVQETMLRAWRHPERVAGRTGAPRAWLYTVARHLAIDQHRARQARPAEPAGLTVEASRPAPDQIDAAIAQWDLATRSAAGKEEQTAMNPPVMPAPAAFGNPLASSPRPARHVAPCARQRPSRASPVPWSC